LPRGAAHKETAFSKLVLLHFTRHPKAFEDALSRNPDLHAVREALISAGCSHTVQRGAKVFVMPHEYASVREAAQLHKLGPSHVVVSEHLVPQVMDVMGSLPHKANVRIKGGPETIAYTAIDEAVANGSIVVRRTFLHFEEPHDTHDTKSVSNSTAVAHGGKNPRCASRRHSQLEG